MNNLISKNEQGFKATIIADSLSPLGDRITTVELEYNRYIHSELMTHRLFSRNAMSSRAVPVDKMIEQSTATPYKWGANQRGMQADTELVDANLTEAKELWEDARETAKFLAGEMTEVGLHKQIANRVLEPYQRMKTIVTATEWDNFFKLRLAEDAQPEIRLLASLIKDLMDTNEPRKLAANQWHTPYVSSTAMCGEVLYFLEGDAEEDSKAISEEEALAISSSCCAQVSYRNIDNSYDKALDIYSKLGVGTEAFHASPFEHMAKPMDFNNIFDDPESETDFKDCFKFTLDGSNGITHVDGKGDLWSGNFKGFIQHRQIL